MHITQPLLRTGPVVAAAAALPLVLSAGPAVAGPGISVSTTGNTVSVTTSACSQINGSWGTASLLSSGQTSFSEGRQVALSGANGLQSAAWSNVGRGTFTVIVICSNNITAGSQSVIVSPTSPTSTPTISATASPSRGVMGGLGGAAKDYGPVTLGVGAALVGTGIIATGWFLRRRSKPYRL